MGDCYRCQTVVEPLVSKQWFVKIKPLAEPAIEAVREGRIDRPERWTKTYLHWMENIRDWCISRQLWWGHRIPVWYCDADGSMHVSRDRPHRLPDVRRHRAPGPRRARHVVLFGALAVLDPGLAGPDPRAARPSIPTAVLVTGYDILFFWVARMIMIGLHFMGEVPFREVYIHALVRDAEGQKMCKTQGQRHRSPRVHRAATGTDALRFTLAALAGPGPRHSPRRGADRGLPQLRQQALERRALRAPATSTATRPAAARGLARLADRWIDSRLSATIHAVRRALRRYRFNEAAAALYQFIWHELCDWYLEIAKLSLYQPESPALARAPSTPWSPCSSRPCDCSIRSCRSSPRRSGSSCPIEASRSWWRRIPARARPTPTRGRAGDESVIELVTAIRNIRGEMRIAPGVTLAATVRAADEHLALFQAEASPDRGAGADPRLTIDREARADSRHRTRRRGARPRCTWTSRAWWIWSRNVSG